MVRSAQLFLQKWGGFAVAHACDVANKFVILIGYAYLNRWYLMVIGHEGGFCLEMVTLFCTGYKHDIVRYSEGQLAMLVHQGGYGKVG